MLVTKGAFRRYQQKFYSMIMRTPHEITLELFTVKKAGKNSEFNLDDFVGDSERISEKFTFQALYEKDISTRAREKYGITNLVNGIVYLSPLQLEPALGTYRIDKDKTVVHFNGAVQVIDKLDYLEEMYGSCVSLQIFLKDATKGG